MILGLGSSIGLFGRFLSPLNFHTSERIFGNEFPSVYVFYFALTSVILSVICAWLFIRIFSQLAAIESPFGIAFNVGLVLPSLSCLGLFVFFVLFGILKFVFTLIFVSRDWTLPEAIIGILVEISFSVNVIFYTCVNTLFRGGWLVFPIATASAYLLVWRIRIARQSSTEWRQGSLRSMK